MEKISLYRLFHHLSIAIQKYINICSYFVKTLRKPLTTARDFLCWGNQNNFFEKSGDIL